VRPGGRLRIACTAALVVAGLALAAPARAADPTTTTRVAVTAVDGVTRTTVAVGGIVADDLASVGADIGAQARFARANAHGGVAGRTIQYTNVTAAAAPQIAASVFAVVPAMSATLDTAGLARSGVPFFGAASSTGWDANSFGFGFVGAQAALQTRVVSPAWGSQLRALLGSAQGSDVSLAVDADDLGTARAEQARRSLLAAGFRVAAPVTLPAPPAALPDLAPVATSLSTGTPAVVLLLTSPATTTALAQQLTRLGFTGTVATADAFYQPTAPAIANGLTVLVPYAPFEQSTAANRRLAADVEAFAAGTKLTPAIAAGYWSADAFLRVLAKVGKRVTRTRFLAAANGKFTFTVPGTIGRVTWPAMHTQMVPCGALVQSDGSRYLVAERYRCAVPIVGRATTTKKAK
jgi:branched-chain amino acid transport system substrate-binding protein